MSPIEINRGLAELLPRTTYHLVESEEDKDALFRLRYAAYLAEEAIAPNAAEKLFDRFDDQSNSFNIAVKVAGRLFGAMRVCVWSRQFDFQTTPGMEVFREELAPYLTEDAVINDPNRFVVDAAFTRNEKVFAFAVMRINFMACIKFRVTTAISTARREHCGFYRRAYGHKQLTEPRFYPGLIKPLALLVNVFSDNFQPTIDKYPSFAPQGDDLEAIFDGLATKSCCCQGARS